MPLHPRIRIRPAVPADARACQEIRRMAFSPGVVWRCMYPNGFSDAASQQLAENMAKEIEGGAGQDKAKSYVLVAELMPPDGSGSAGGAAADGDREAAVPPAGTEATEAEGVAAVAAAAATHGTGNSTEHDPVPPAEILRSTESNGTIIAWAKWHLYREEQPEADWAVHRPATRERYGDAADLELCETFFGGLHKMRKEHIQGRPHFLLSLIACAPDYQRMGAASALIRWGTGIADQEGAVSWLESSPAGYRVYRHLGFRDVTVLDLDITGRWGVVRTETEDWGTKNAVDVVPITHEDGWFRTVLMKREPAAKVPT